MRVILHLHLLVVWMCLYFAIKQVRARDDFMAAFGTTSALVNIVAAYHVATT